MVHRLAEAPCKFQFVDIQGTSSMITADEAGIYSFLSTKKMLPSIPRQVVNDVNYPFVLAWLATFAHDPPTAVEVTVPFLVD